VPTVDPETIDPAALSFELPNVGPGPDPLTLAAVAEEYEFLVVLLQRDHYCTNCRDQVKQVGDRYAAFRDRGAQVVSVVPEPRDSVREWQDRYDLPYPLLADPEADLGERYDQPVRFGLLGRFSDFFGRMPEAVVLDLRAEPRVVYVHRGSSTFDRPTVEELLAAIDEAAGD
jgi:peroxiredoxin Q/BCP